MAAAVAAAAASGASAVAAAAVAGAFHITASHSPWLKLADELTPECAHPVVPLYALARALRREREGAAADAPEADPVLALRSRVVTSRATVEFEFGARDERAMQCLVRAEAAAGNAEAINALGYATLFGAAERHLWQGDGADERDLAAEDTDGLHTDPLRALEAIRAAREGGSTGRSSCSLYATPYDPEQTAATAFALFELAAARGSEAGAHNALVLRLCRLDVRPQQPGDSDLWRWHRRTRDADSALEALRAHVDRLLPRAGAAATAADRSSSSSSSSAETGIRFAVTLIRALRLRCEALDANTGINALPRRCVGTEPDECVHADCDAIDALMARPPFAAVLRDIATAAAERTRTAKRFASAIRQRAALLSLRPLTDDDSGSDDDLHPPDPPPPAAPTPDAARKAVRAARRERVRAALVQHQPLDAADPPALAAGTLDRTGAGDGGRTDRWWPPLLELLCDLTCDAPLYEVADACDSLSFADAPQRRAHMRKLRAHAQALVEAQKLQPAQNFVGVTGFSTRHPRDRVLSYALLQLATEQSGTGMGYARALAMRATTLPVRPTDWEALRPFDRWPSDEAFAAAEARVAESDDPRAVEVTARAKADKRAQRLAQIAAVVAKRQADAKAKADAAPAAAAAAIANDAARDDDRETEGEAESEAEGEAESDPELSEGSARDSNAESGADGAHIWNANDRLPLLVLPQQWRTWTIRSARLPHGASASVYELAFEADRRDVVCDDERVAARDPPYATRRADELALYQASSARGSARALVAIADLHLHRVFAEFADGKGDVKPDRRRRQPPRPRVCAPTAAAMEREQRLALLYLRRTAAVARHAGHNSGTSSDAHRHAQALYELACWLDPRRAFDTPQDAGPWRQFHAALSALRPGSRAAWLRSEFEVRKHRREEQPAVAHKLSADENDGGLADGREFLPEYVCAVGDGSSATQAAVSAHAAAAHPNESFSAYEDDGTACVEYLKEAVRASPDRPHSSANMALATLEWCASRSFQHKALRVRRQPNRASEYTFACGLQPDERYESCGAESRGLGALPCVQYHLLRVVERARSVMMYEHNQSTDFCRARELLVGSNWLAPDYGERHSDRPKWVYNAYDDVLYTW